MECTLHHVLDNPKVLNSYVSVDFFSCDSRLRKCQLLLERMLRGDCFDEILWQRCNNKTRSSETRQESGNLNETRQGSGRVSSYECELRERLVTLIATLPDRMTGKLQAHTRQVLLNCVVFDGGKC